MAIQPKSELEQFYHTDDPWGYYNNPDDAHRKSTLLSLLPERDYQSTLDIGCGNGFITEHLPGKKVSGCDLSEKAVAYAKEQAAKAGKNIDYFAADLFSLTPQTHGKHDLIVITGILYPQYIGNASTVIHAIIDELLEDGGILVSCHIDDWNPPNFPYLLLDRSFYPYREYYHRLDVYQK